MGAAAGCDKKCYELSITQASLVVVLSHPWICDSGFVNVLMVGHPFSHRYSASSYSCAILPRLSALPSYISVAT